MKKYEYNSISICLIFIAAVVSTIVLAFILSVIYEQFATKLPIDPSILVVSLKNQLNPEPLERFIFLFLSITIPCVFFVIAIKSSDDACKRRMSFLPSKVVVWVRYAAILVAIALLYFPFVGFDFSQKLITNHSLPSEHPVLVLMKTLCIATVWALLQRYFFTKKFNFVQRISRGLPKFIWLFLSLVAFIQLGAWRIVNENAIFQSYRWDGHVESIFYALGQVMAGKTLLVDLPSIYGLFPEMIRPIFKLTTFSVLSFTVFCGVLQVFSLAAIYWVMDRIVRDNVIKVSFGLALLMITFGTTIWLIGLADPYYQYWPIRFFWPAMAVFFFYRYSQHPTLMRAFAVSFVGALGTLWNLDSGIAIEFAFAGVLCVKWIVLQFMGQASGAAKTRHIYKILCLHVATMVTMVLLMMGYLSLKGGEPIHWAWLIGSQNLFYKLGYMMMPMPLHLHPWMSVLGIYLISIITVATSWSKYPNAKHTELLLFLSFLGIALFVYYQGRSHDLNLIAVCWPSLMLIALLADRVVRATRTTLLSPFHLVFSIAGVSVLIFCSMPILFSLKTLSTQTVNAYKNRHVVRDVVVHDELKFIRSHTHPGEECVIISQRQGLYLALAGLKSSISGPGILETMLQKDHDAFVNTLIQKRHTCIFIGVNASHSVEFGEDPMIYLNAYTVVAHNTYGTMLYLQPS